MRNKNILVQNTFTYCRSMGNWTTYCFRPRPPKIWEDLAAFRKYHMRDWFDKQNKNNPDGCASLSCKAMPSERPWLTPSFWKGQVFFNSFTKNHAFLTFPVSKFVFMLWKFSKPTPKQPQPHNISLQTLSCFSLRYENQMKECTNTKSK